MPNRRDRSSRRGGGTGSGPVGRDPARERRKGKADRPPLPPGFWTIWSTVALDLLGFGIVLPILPLFVERFDAGPATIGFLVASFSLAQLICSPLLGRLSDRIGRKPVILISLAGTALGSLLTGLAGTVWLLFLGRIVDGASGASVSVAQGAVSDLAPPEERPRLFGLLGAAFGVGFVLGPALGGLGALWGPRVPFFLAAGIAAVNAVVALRRLPETHPKHRSADVVALEEAPADVVAEGESLLSGATGRAEATMADAATEARSAAIDDAARKHDLALLALVAFVAIAGFSGFEATFALLGQRRFSLTEGSVTPVFVFIGLALVVVQGGLVRPVVATLGPLRTLRTALVLVTIGMLALAAATSWPVLLIALLLLVGGQGLSTPTLSTLVANRAAVERRGQALGVQQSAGALARIVGPAMAGVLFEHAGVPVPYLVAAALTAVALGLLVSVRIKDPETAQAPA